MTDETNAATDVDPTRMHPARLYDYFLGGKDWYAVDKEAALKAEQEYPRIGHAARRNRAFLQRAAGWLAKEGIDQYLDIGTGIPNEPNLHDVVWSIRPAAKIVYADHDATVLAYAQPFVKRTGGRAAYIHANVVDTETILAEARKHLDFDRPIALSVIALWHFISDDYTPDGSTSVYRPVDVMKQLLDSLPPGSYLALSHVTRDLDPEQGDRLADIYRRRGIPAQARSHSEILRLFGGLDLVSPGLVDVDQWHPELGGTPADGHLVPVYAGIARKP